MLLAGFYEREITPPIGGDMPGALVVHKAETVESRLYVKAVAMENANKRSVIIMLDLLNVNRAIHDAVVERVHAMTGIKNEEIMITATHTHYGPPINDKSEYNRLDEPYFDVLVRLIADCAVLAFRKMEPVTVKYGESQVDGISFCRDIKLKDGRVITNPTVNPDEFEEYFSEIDKTFTMLYFINEEGQPIGALMNFACHNCCVKLGGLSSDYSGYAAKELKKTFGYEFVTVFMNGFCGDVNHIDFSIYHFVKECNRGAHYKTERYIQMGKILAKEAVRLYETAKEINTDILAVEKEIILLKRREVPQEMVDEAKELYATMSLDEVLMNLSKLGINATGSKYYLRTKSKLVLDVVALPEEIETYIQVIRLGDCLIYGIPYEMYSEFALDLRKRTPSKLNILTEQTNCLDTGAYVPGKKVFGTDIYAAHVLSSIFEPDAGYKMIDKAVELANKLMNI